MKNIIVIIIAFATMSSVNAQSKIDTISFQVTGVCGMCKSRIEDAGLIKGVKSIEWNKEKQEVTVVYNTKKTNQKTIEKAIASKGHDTENCTATDEDYQKLPGCCLYRDGVEVH